MMTRRSKIWWVIAFVATLTLLNACKTSKQIVVPVGKTSLNKRQFLSAYQQMKDCPVVDANGKLTIVTDGKSNISLGNIGFRWSLDRDKAFVLSIRPMAIMEAGRLTIANDRMMILDRIGKRVFLEENLDNSSLLLKNVVGINTDIFKAMVQNQPFGLISVGSDALHRMRFSKNEKYYILTDRLRPGGHEITHTFDAALNLIESYVTIADKANIKISYWDFIRIDQDQNIRPIPSVIRLDVEILNKPSDHYRMQINFDKVKQSFSQKIETEIPRGYQRVTLIELMKIISSL